MADRLTTEQLDDLERMHRESKRGAWYRTCTGELPLTHGAAMTFEDACLIVAAINALPRLIATAREEETLRARVADLERERDSALADRDALRAALQEALPYVESAAAETFTYGAFPGGDPRQFTPEPSESTDEEREAHRAACARWDAAATPLDGEPSAHQWEGDRHVAHAKYGHGTYLYRDPHASALLTAIRALLDAAERGEP